jgi:integrase
MKLPEGLYRPKYRDVGTGQLKESAVLWVRYYRGGKKVRVSSGTKNVKEAVVFRDKCKGRRQPVTTALRRTSFEDLKALVITEYEVNKRRSKRRIEEAFQHLESFFAFALASEIESDRIDQYVAYRQKEGSANATINRELCALRRGYKLAARARRVDHVPFFQRLTEAAPRQGFFEREQLDVVLKHLPEPLRAPLIVAFITGWRVHSEVLTRQKKHLSLGDGVLRLEPGETKNRQAREFPVDAVPELREVLKRQQDSTREFEIKTGHIVSHLFHRQGKPIISFTRAWKTACKAAGLEGKIPHDFRRTAARNLIRAGVSTQVAKLLTGHITDSVFERYAIVDEKMKHDAVAQLAILLQKDKERSAKIAPIGTMGTVLGHGDLVAERVNEKSA